jgi:hypothetical protein
MESVEPRNPRPEMESQIAEPGESEKNPPG